MTKVKKMRYVKQLGVILAVSFVGEVLNGVIPLPVPAGIYGIVILFLLLLLKVLPLSAVEGTADFLIEIMPLMFIPAAAGLIDSWVNIKSSVVVYVAITILSTVVVMGVSGAVTQLVIRMRKRKNNGEGEEQK